MMILTFFFVGSSYAVFAVFRDIIAARCTLSLGMYLSWQGYVLHQLRPYSGFPSSGGPDPMRNLQKSLCLTLDSLTAEHSVIPDIQVPSNDRHISSTRYGSSLWSHFCKIDDQFRLLCLWCVDSEVLVRADATSLERPLLKISAGFCRG